MYNSIINEDMKYILKNIEVEKIKRKTFFITGANGSLGRYIVDFLMYLNLYIFSEDEKCKVIALCRNEKKADECFRKYNKYYEFILLIQCVEEKIKVAEKIDYIFHAACKSNTSEFAKNPVGIINANTLGTLNLLEFAREKKVKGFLFFSSGAVYGDLSCKKEYVKENESYSVDPLVVENCYAESKRMGENLCACYYKQYKIPTKIIRIGHTYGPYSDLNDGHIYSDFAKSIINNENLIIKNDGSIKRAFCYISDAVISFFLVLFYGKNGEAYNMSNNNCFLSINELAQILVNDAFREKKLSIKYLKDQKVNDNIQVSLDTRKIEELGWNPKVSVKEGFISMISNYSK